MIDYSTTERIASVKRRASVPTNQNLFLDSDFVKILSDGLIDTVLPMIMSVREDYFLTYQDTLVGAGVSSLNIPVRAVGGKLKDVVFVDPSTGNATEDLPRLSYADISLYQPADYIKMRGFYVEGDKVKFFPPDIAEGKTVRLYYFRRPSRLVEVSATGKVVAINTTTKEVQLNNVPTTWTTSTELDVIEGVPPFKSLADDVNVTLIAGFVLTFLTLPTGLAVGDYIAEAMESPIPQIPFEAFGYLDQLGAVKVIEAVGTTEEVQKHAAMAQALEKKLFTMLTPRVDNAPQKIVSRNGLFRSARGMYWPR